MIATSSLYRIGNTTMAFTPQVPELFNLTLALHTLGLFFAPLFIATRCISLGVMTFIWYETLHLDFMFSDAFTVT